MAEVVGVTYERAIQIENASISSGRVDPSTGRLVLTRRDGGSTDAGLVRAPSETIGIYTTDNFSKGDYPGATEFRFQLWGAGGAGGNATTENPGGGGGGGGYAEILLKPEDLDYNTSIYVGMGGYAGSPGGSTFFTLLGEHFGPGGGGVGVAGYGVGDQFAGGGGGGLNHDGSPADGASANAGVSAGAGGGKSAPPGPSAPGPQIGGSAIALHHGGSGSYGRVYGGDAWYGGAGGNSGNSWYGGAGGGAGGGTIISDSSDFFHTLGGWSRMGGNGGRGGVKNSSGFHGQTPAGGGGGAGAGVAHAQGGMGGHGACIITIYYS